MRQTRKIGVAVSLLASLTIAGTAFADTTVHVWSGSSHWYPADTRAPGTGTFETGPAMPPYGTGSFELRTPIAPLPNPNAAKVQLLTDLYNGTKLSAIQGIGYSTYRDSTSTGDPATVAAINIRVDQDGNGTSDAYMVYEPYQDLGVGAVLTGVWQTWDAYRAGAAKWWFNNSAGGCGQATPCTWNAILLAFPQITVREAPSCGPGAAPVSPCPGSLGVNQGSANPGIISNVDGLWVTLAGNKTIYNFEAAPPTPATKDDCKKGGWQSLYRANGTPFKNQGDCIQYVNTGK